VLACALLLAGATSAAAITSEVPAIVNTISVRKNESRALRADLYMVIPSLRLKIDSRGGNSIAGIRLRAGTQWQCPL
jgi:hypothetical protein